MRILFLDDDVSRTRKFQQRTIGHNTVCIETPEEAFNALDKYPKFDIASLDHDLFGKIFQPSDDKSGFAVCEHIDNMNADDRPERVICHSYNDQGVEAMTALLPTAIAAPFGSDAYWNELGVE
jgi:hypothetical protein